MKNRKIIHIDMDAFYASVEQLDNPELKNKPIAVGGNEERGVISAASYEARKFGVRSAMSSKIAKKKCPDLIFVKPRFERYKEIAVEIRNIFKRYTDCIEPLSLDEAYLDVTQNKLNLSSATFIAQSIKNDIKNELNLIASAGISYNKFLAKMASDEDKPDGLFVVEPHEAINYLNKLPIQRFYGIGKVTADKMMELGIVNGKTLRNFTLDFLIKQFGKAGNFYFQICRGIDERKVESYRERKSIACETTFLNDIHEKNVIETYSSKLLIELWKRYEKENVTAKTIQLKLKFNDFTIITKSKTSTNGFETKIEIENEINFLISSIFPLKLPIRLLGFQLSNFANKEVKDFYYQTKIDF